MVTAEYVAAVAAFELLLLIAATRSLVVRPVLAWASLAWLLTIVASIGMLYLSIFSGLGIGCANGCE
jgi:hypothetical protein